MTSIDRKLSSITSRKNTSDKSRISTSNVAKEQKNQISINRTTRGSLHSAVQNGKINIVKDILSREFSANVMDTLERTLLHVAALNGDNSMVKLLLQHGAKLDVRDYQGLTPIHLAAEAGHLRTFTILLRTPDADGKLMSINIRTNNDQTPLHFAALKGHLHLIKYIIRNGGDVEAREHNGYSPLLLAVIGSHPEPVRELVKHVADFSYSPQYKRLIFIAASGDAHLLILSHRNKVLRRKPQLSVEKELKCAEIIDILIDAGCPFINEQFSKGTPLYAALNYKHDLIVEKLIQRGCNVNIICQNGRSALHKAAHVSHPRIVKTLLNAGADVNQKCSLGLLPIHYVAITLKYRNLSTLINAGADINARTTLNQTIIEVLKTIERCTQKRLMFLYIVLNYGFDINATDSEGNIMLLNTLCASEYCELTTVLLDWYLDFNAENNFGCTLLEKLSLNPGNTKGRVKLVIKMMLVMESTKKLEISMSNEAVIFSNLLYFDFYEQCKEELEVLKMIKVWDEISFFEFLDKPLKKLLHFTRNEDLMNVLKIGVFTLFPVYGGIMASRIRFARRLRDLHDKSYSFVEKFFYPRFLPHVVVEEILKFLNVDEMENLSFK